MAIATHQQNGQRWGNENGNHGTHFGIRLLKVGLKPPTADCVAAGKGENDAGQRNGVENARFDVARPLPGQADRWASCHLGLQMNGGESPMLTLDE